jgi:hypothetical protein
MRASHFSIALPMVVLLLSGCAAGDVHRGEAQTAEHQIALSGAGIDPEIDRDGLGKRDVPLVPSVGCDHHRTTGLRHREGAAGALELVVDRGFPAVHVVGELGRREAARPAPHGEEARTQIDFHPRGRRTAGVDGAGVGAERPGDDRRDAASGEEKHK